MYTFVCYFKISQFVKLGQSMAEISIELYKKSNHNIKLRRTIFVEKEASQYYINNVMVLKRKVKNIKGFQLFNHLFFLSFSIYSIMNLLQV